MTTRPISTLLIANRGEIARRIQRTAREMGIRTVAVYADADREAPFVREADEAVALDGQSAGETYLSIERLLSAAQRTGADAVHPGYGFLAENAGFASAVTDAGLVWVGPPADAIAAMGDKLAAKHMMREAGVPTLESVEIAGDTLPDALELPTLLKAAAGGGGKGMRVVRDRAEGEEALASARREAARAFGDERIFGEPYLEGCRHIEIQVLADRHGHVVHCFERECSIQRRHQKIIEEAPSPAISSELREEMGRAAVTAASAIRYQNAGTVEFLVDRDGRFYFLEMNTRLQVEHPVTEAVCGLDLVRQQLLVAQEEPLGFTQDDLRIEGHAIEARVYAEDPDNDFLPSVGTLAAWVPSPLARLDSGVETGDTVTADFDPLLAKAITHAPTRSEAARRLALALEQTTVAGIKTNRDFLVELLRHPAFLAGETTTDFLERNAVSGRRVLTSEERHLAGLAVAMRSQHANREAATALRTVRSGWRNSVMPPERMHMHDGETELTVSYRSRRDGSFVAEIEEASHTVRVAEVDGTCVSLEVNGGRASLAAVRDGDMWWVHGPWGDVALKEIPRFPEAALVGVAGGLSAPMPGKIVAVHVAEGDPVASGDLLVVMEGMKMEHHVRAPHDGVVKEVRVAVDDQVDQGALLLAVEEDESSPA